VILHGDDGGHEGTPPGAPAATSASVKPMRSRFIDGEEQPVI